MYIELHIVKVLFYSLYYIKQKSLCIWKCIINIFALQRISCFNFILESIEDAWHAYGKTTVNCFTLLNKYWANGFGNMQIHEKMGYEYFSKEDRKKDLAYKSS